MKVRETFDANEQYKIRQCRISRRRWTRLLIFALVICLLNAAFALYKGYKTGKELGLELTNFWTNDYMKERKLTGPEFTWWEMLTIQARDRYCVKAEAQFNLALLLILILIVVRHGRQFIIMDKLRAELEKENPEESGAVKL